MKERKKIIIILSITLVIFFGYLYKEAENNQKERNKSIARNINKATDAILSPLDSIADKKNNGKNGVVILNYTEKGVYLASDTNIYYKLQELTHSNDFDNIDNLIKSGDVLLIPNKTSAKLTGDNQSYNEVRILEGKYAGVIGYTFPDAVWRKWNNDRNNFNQG